MIKPENTVVLPKNLSGEEETDLKNCYAVGHLLDLLRYFRTVIKKDKEQEATLLDVGCRDDATRPFFAARGFNWVGIDLNPNNMSILKGDMHSLPVGNESIDFIFCSHVLEHSERPIDALREFKRALKIGGYLFLATPAYSEYQIFYCDKEHVNVITMAQARRWAQHLGYEIIHQTYVKNEMFEDRLASLVTLLRVVNK